MDLGATGLGFESAAVSRTAGARWLGCLDLSVGSPGEQEADKQRGRDETVPALRHRALLPFEFMCKFGASQRAPRMGRWVT